ncbi:MAG: DNA-binding protein [Muribaculaceae bacterium]|nr:DNA-binding protein [Muribaculaceae bacterium]
MCNEEPKINDNAVYNIKETCAILCINRDTLRDRTRKGLILPLNPLSARGFKYSGKAIRRLWCLENYMPYD